MILPFVTKFQDGSNTDFVVKIWRGLFSVGIHVESQYIMNGPDVNIDDYIVTKSKLHTVREDKKNRWKAGRHIHFVINNRSKNYFQFAPVIPCVSVQEIEIECLTDYFNDVTVKVDGKFLAIEQKQQLAWNDGFACLADFYLYFRGNFKGKIIHWTDLKY